MANSVTKTKKSEVKAFDASMFESDAGQGNENIGSDDLALPFLKLLSTVTGEAFSGKDGISVIPCAYQRVFIEWMPRGTGSGAPRNIYKAGDVIPKTKRDPDDNKEYVVDGEGEYIEETAQHYVLVVNEDGSTETALLARQERAVHSSTVLSYLQTQVCG